MIVPIVPDEARTFSMEALFVRTASTVRRSAVRTCRRCNAHSVQGKKDGQILGRASLPVRCRRSSRPARRAPSGYQHDPLLHLLLDVGFQRIGDLIWAAADMMTKGFLVGGTAGRTTLAGEGLQHQDGHSHLLAYPVPNLLAYDPASPRSPSSSGMA